MHKIKLIYLLYSPLSPRWLSYFCIDEMTEWFDVEYWDCTKLLPDQYKSAFRIERDYVFVMESMADLETNLKRIPQDSIIINEIHFSEAKNECFHKIVSSYVPSCVEIDIWTYTPFKLDAELSNANKIAVKDSILIRFKHFLYKNTPIRLICKEIRFRGKYNIKKDIDCHRKQIKEKKSIENENRQRRLYHIYNITYKPHQEYSINHVDYEKYLQIKDVTDIRYGKYIVFIDQYYPLHPDFEQFEKSLNLKSLAASQYSSLNHFFDLIEKQTDCKIVIAAHPSADYACYNPFEGREIVYYKTAELVKDATAAFSMGSNAISFVILFNKPFCTITSNAIKQSPRCSNFTKKYANAIGQEVVDIDAINDVRNIFKCISPDIREHYLSGLADINETRRNPELYKENFIKIHNDIIKRMYDKNQ